MWMVQGTPQCFASAAVVEVLLVTRASNTNLRCCSRTLVHVIVPAPMRIKHRYNSL